MSDRIKESAIRAWQHDLAKFFPKSKRPTETEIRMFELGYEQALEDNNIYVYTEEDLNKLLKIKSDG